MKILTECNLRRFNPEKVGNALALSGDCLSCSCSSRGVNNTQYA